jgi:hypothetical protein
MANSTRIRKTALLALFIMSLVATAALLYRPAVNSTGCKLCIIHLTVKDSTIIEAKLNYASSNLPNSNVIITVNNKYEDTVRTNSSSYIKVSAPLGIGQNLIRFSYNGSSVAAYIGYFGNYLAFALVPVGAAFFLFIKFFYSRSDQRKPISFYNESDNGGCSATELECAFSSLAESNERQRFVKELPQNPEEVANGLSSYGGCANAPDVIYLSKKIKAYGIAEEKFGLLKRGTLSLEDIAAYKIYDAAVNEGIYETKNASTPKDLLERNGAIMFIGLTPDTLCKSVSHSGKALLIIPPDEQKPFEHTTRSFTKLGALIIMLDLSGMMGVLQW